MKVLLLVDIQNDFCLGGSLAVPEGDQVVPVANRLINSGEYDLVIASRDMHPVDHISFASNHEGGSVFETIDLSYDGKSYKQTLWPDHCVEGTRGVELHPDLETEKIDYFIDKGTDRYLDSYSAFYDNARLAQTGLMDLLTKEAEKRGGDISSINLDAIGLATDFCVSFSALDSLSLGIKTRIILDGCRAINKNPSDDIKMLRKLSECGVEIVEFPSRKPERQRGISVDRR